jgi:tetratricopeptide (TPR) repeat protein
MVASRVNRMRAIRADRQGAAESGRVRSSLALGFLARQVLGFGLGTVLLASTLLAQDTGRTVRHHRVAEADSSFPPELSQAEDDIAKKDFAGAEPLLKTVVERDAGNFQAWFDLGYVDNALGKKDEAIAAYRKSVAAKPNVFESNLNLGLMLAEKGQPGAEQFLRAATKLTPTAEIDEGHARAWMGLAQVLEASDPAESADAYLQVATLRPKDPEPRLSAGVLFEKQNRFADAEQQYRQALAIDPASPNALTALANLYMRGRRFGEAEDMLRKLLALHPEDPRAHMQLGRMLAADGQNDAAIAELQATLKMAPNDLGVQRDLADLYAMTGKYDLAQAAYQALLGSNPKDSDLHYRLGQALLRQRKFPPAQQEFLAAVQLKPDFGGAYGDLAVAANENKNYVGVIAALDARAKFLPEIPIGYFLRATAYDHLRNYKLAAVNYHKFLAVANGQFPDNEWQARHRLIAIEPKK